MELLKSLGEKIAYHKQRPQRIEGLADGVFAIVMTLLVLDIRIPSMEMNTEKDMWFSLSRTLPMIFTFILSFLVVGQLWTVFSNQFNYIHAADRNEIIIAIFFLLFVSLIPFSTSFLSKHLWSSVAFGFYVLNVLLALLLLTLHWIYSYHTGLVQVERRKKPIIHKALMRRAKTAFIGYGFVAACCLINSYLALCATILLQSLFTFIGFIEIVYTAWRKKLKNFSGGNFKFSQQVK